MRRMGGLSKKIPITYVTMLIGSLAIAGHPAAGRLLLEGRDPGRVVQARLRVGLGHRLRRGRPDRVLHVPAHGPDLLGRVPRAEGDLGQDPRVAAGHDHPADPAGHPVGLPRACTSACRSATSRITEWLAPIFDEGEAILHGGAAEPAYQLFGIDGVLILASVTIATIGIVLAWRLFGVELGPIRTAVPPRARPRADRPGAVPVPRVAQQVVVRRPLPPAVHGHRRADRGGHLVVRPRGHRRHRQRHRHGRPSTPAAGCARSRPAGSRTTRSASPSG